MSSVLMRYPDDVLPWFCWMTVLILFVAGSFDENSVAEDSVDIVCITERAQGSGTLLRLLSVRANLFLLKERAHHVTCHIVRLRVNE